MKKKQMLYSQVQAARLRRINAASLHQSAPGEADVIVSLTSIPSRFAALDLVVRSILSKRVVPQRVVLWINGEFADGIPDSVRALEGPKFEIRETEGNAPHRKLLPAMQAFPGKAIVTCDDDMMMRRGWLRSLVNIHQQAPDAIVSNIVRRIAFDSRGRLLPYDKWPKLRQPDLQGGEYLPIGYGGVLYPPGCFHDDAQRADLYMQLAPRADDLWFKMMAALKGTPVRTGDRRVRRPREIVGADEVRLKTSNVNQDGNRAQWLALCDHYQVSSAELLAASQA